MAKKKSPNKENAAAEELMRMLFDRMQSENNAKALNANAEAIYRLVGDYLAAKDKGG